MWPLVPTLYISSCHVPPVDTTRRVRAYGGRAVNHSQQGRCTSQPKSVASWCTNPPRLKTASLRWSHYKTNNNKKVKNDRRWCCEGVQASRLEECLMSECLFPVLCHLLARGAAMHSVWVPRLHPKQQTLLSTITLDTRQPLLVPMISPLSSQQQQTNDHLSSVEG